MNPLYHYRYQTYYNIFHRILFGFQAKVFKFRGERITTKYMYLNRVKNNFW